ncbi:hypothetical protein R0135_10405 [Congregibacter variabilis]|uniref:Lipocalin-like domain-containing protein n=1 Tax=Congregibacter variabilis TaxID=3081200 RepID=A0ABZ0HY86_9GAMM|nr:hypothetical protein R0135_10405 [Congregibacter sp. IMCC43200]
MLALPLLLAACSAGVLGDSTQASLKAAEGLWEYTDLITRDGESLPLTGIFLIKNDMFLQQSIFKGDPFAEQGSMAHAGPYWAGGAGLRLRSNQTLSMDPTQKTPLSSAGAMEHDLKVTRDGKDLTLQFGGGTSTIQTFRHLSNAENTQIISFAKGNLALTENYFILVNGDGNGAVTGYGSYERINDKLMMTAVRWAESDGTTVKNLRDVELSATLSPSAFTLSDGRSFTIVD